MEHTMNTLPFTFADADLRALPSGALYWPDQGCLIVADLHLGKSARVARMGGATLPPYEARETLSRLSEDLSATCARQVICLGDSFDFPDADRELPETDLLRLTRMQAGVDWVWIAGNHDPGPVSLGGSHRAEMALNGLVFRHIATPDGVAEVSGHFHPKVRLALRGRAVVRPCFLFDDRRLILPAYGAYTGGLFVGSASLAAMMGPKAEVILTGSALARLRLDRLAPLRGQAARGQ